jgi:hypothetical protein
MSAALDMLRFAGPSVHTLPYVAGFASCDFGVNFNVGAGVAEAGTEMLHTVFPL